MKNILQNLKEELNSIDQPENNDNKKREINNLEEFNIHIIKNKKSSPKFMRKVILLFLFFTISIVSAQTFNQKETKRLNSFGVNMKSIDINENSNYLNLNNILLKDKKRRRTKTFGIVLTSLSALTTTFGALVFSNSKGDEEGLGQSIGTMFMTIGAIELGISIPLFISSNKRKKERNELILKYQ